MGIKKLLQDLFKKIDFIDGQIGNPFLNIENQANPFAKFYSGTYIWIEPPEDKP